MFAWEKIVYVGHTGIMIPAAAGIAASLAAGRAWRAALWWSLLFIAGLAVVAVSKMAFMGWGVGIRAIDFKALSGHAMRTAAVAPVGLYLLLHRATPAVRAFGTILGIAIGVAMAVCLVAFGYHSVSETLAGFVVGSVVSLGFIGTVGAAHGIRPSRWLLPCGVLVFVLVWHAKPASFQYWMHKGALRLSGNDSTYSWRTWELRR